VRVGEEARVLQVEAPEPARAAGVPALETALRSTRNEMQSLLRVAPRYMEQLPPTPSRIRREFNSDRGRLCWSDRAGNRSAVPGR